MSRCRQPKFQMAYLVLHLFEKIIFFFSKFMGPFSIIIKPGQNLNLICLFGKTLDMQFQIYSYPFKSYSAETESSRGITLSKYHLAWTNFKCDLHIPITNHISNWTWMCNCCRDNEQKVNDEVMTEGVTHTIYPMTD